MAIYLSIVDFDVILLRCNPWLPLLQLRAVRVLRALWSHYQRPCMLSCCFLFPCILYWDKQPDRRSCGVCFSVCFLEKKYTFQRDERKQLSPRLAKSSEPQRTYLMNGECNKICVKRRIVMIESLNELSYTKCLENTNPLINFNHNVIL